MFKGAMIMPGNSTDEVVLVGYSARFEQPGWSCIKSKFLNRTGEWVNRTLEYKFQGFSEALNITYEQEVKTKISIKVSKYRDVLEVGHETWPRVYTGGNTKYQIRYYDNKWCLMSNFIDKIWVLQPCSFWVKTQYLDKSHSWQMKPSLISAMRQNLSDMTQRPVGVSLYQTE
ncbi:hypothetical protein MTO96_031505 [Rhipicephalus appendiculatus]